VRWILCCLVFLSACSAAWAGVMTRPELARRFPAPLIVGERDAELPVWPIFKQNGTATELVGYVFESIDLAPIPGFAGVPVNLLVAIDPKGAFIDVAVLSHHEPVFLDGLGEAPLFQFVSQYRGLSLTQNLSIDSAAKRAGRPATGQVYLDGVAKATASVRIINQSVLSAALKVSRKKLGFGEGRDPDRIARIRTGLFEQLSARQMLDRGLVRCAHVTNRDLEALYAGSAGAGLDAEALARPDALFTELCVAWVSVPSIGRNLLDTASWNRLAARLDDGDHAILVMSRGRHGVIGEDFVRGSVPDRLTLKQDSLPIELRDLDMEMTLADSAALPTQSVAVFRVIGQAGLDPAAPLDFALRVTRSKGIVYPERIVRDIALRYRLAPDYYVAPPSADKAWQGVWSSRKAELLVLAAALALLAGALAMQKRLTANARRYAWFRRGFLLFTIGFIGYYAQGQLSIVNLTGLAQALLARRSLEFFLYDPMTVVLWGFVLVSLFAWGRGTFCGWLCPFGALQELTGKLGQMVRVPQLKIRRRIDTRLKLLKYLLLATILASAVLAPALTDRLVELEPFKTAITLAFVRSWPFVAWAAGLLALSSVSYKFFCRYLCPFGAALALLGRVRLFNWIPRRAECGTPCQACRHACDYGAIEPTGQVSYDECFQCMDCVVIYESDEKCAPLILERKRHRTIPIARAVN
jgi:NosR/NirI family nitrous oxide reductase transcriptional regulator